MFVPEGAGKISADLTAPAASHSPVCRCFVCVFVCLCLGRLSKLSFGYEERSYACVLNAFSGCSNGVSADHLSPLSRTETRFVRPVIDESRLLSK